MTATGTEGKPGAISYLALHLGQLVAGLLLLVVGVAGFIVRPGGLIYLILPLPTYIWVSLVPLAMATLFIFRALVMAEWVTLAWEGDVLKVEARRLWVVRASIRRHDIRYVAIRHLESKVMRWLATFVLLLVSYEVHFTNGIDLLGHASVAPFLLLCFAIVCAALAIHVATPRHTVEIGTDSESRFIPLPARGSKGREIADVARLLGFHDDTISGITRKGNALVVLQNSAFPLATGLAFILIAVALAANRSWYFGDFAVPVFALLGAKWLADALLGDKKLVGGGRADEFRGYTGKFVARQVLGGEARADRAPGITRVHPIEMACYFYLMAQAVKQGFRFALWPHFGFHSAYFVLGLIVLAVIFFKWFGLVGIHVVDFGKVSVAFEIVRGKDAGLQLRSGVKRYVAERARSIAASFVVVRGNKKLLWTWILFVLFLLVPILYYSLALPPFII